MKNSTNSNSNQINSTITNAKNAYQDDYDEEDGEEDGERRVIQAPDGRLVHVGRPAGLLLLGRQRHRLDAAKVLADRLGRGLDVFLLILLEQELQGNDLVEFHPVNEKNVSIDPNVSNFGRFTSHLDMQPTNPSLMDSFFPM